MSNSSVSGEPIVLYLTESLTDVSKAFHTNHLELNSDYCTAKAVNGMELYFPANK